MPLGEATGRGILNRADEFGGDELTTVQNNLGLFYQQQGRSEDAEAYLLKVAERRRLTLAEDDPALLDTYNNLAFVYIAQKRFLDAEPILKRVLEARRAC